MDTSLKRLLLALAAGMALSGCAVYAPPYAYDAAPAAPAYYYPNGYSYYDYGYPAYYWPPVSLNFGYYGHSGYRGGGGWRGRGGWRGHR
ncbi:hypothetical protein [Pseudoduganella sp. RAF53_2]|uniref:hypothetical protein n=1 Tax=unclassified Pseudoduganella TaxID=2637179 RepID=UPI003F993D22